MDAVEQAIRRLGGVATRSELRELASKRQLRRAVDCGVVLRPRRGRYVLAEVDAARALAHGLSAVVSHRSAALAHGWKVKTVPTLAEITVPPGRKITADSRNRASIRSSPLAPDEIVNGLTSPVRTVVDCARWLPFDEALAIADSALRSRSVRATDLARAAHSVRGPGRPGVLRVLRLASGNAANPFESVLRAIALDVPGLDPRPQVGIAVGAGERITPDLVDVSLGIVLEADSHEFHTRRSQLVTDCWRYDELVLGGWDVYRFTYEHVMHRQAWTRSVLERAVVKARRTQQVRCRVQC
ncbi:hypothetical protein GCM10009817_05130 [Terrabacter lapilli]|uniref:AbiEi antitoxin of type IV toxin-antitoxin system n=1 Tax=Terrabacter lapilli TaxID=436231 RepID=A0ABN2RFL0_9MICO